MTRCTEAVAAGRMTKARAFLDAVEAQVAAANTPGVSSVVVTEYVHAGIAAADVICCRSLGRFHSGPDHQGAVVLLKKVDAELATKLNRLLSVKTKAGYSHRPPSARDVKLAQRAALALVEAAEER